MKSARDEAIRAFLRSRPRFPARRYRARCRRSASGRTAANVVDFGAEALSRVARAHRQESSVRQRLEATARDNFEAQGRTHEAVLELIGTRCHADLALTLDELARDRFGLAAAVVALEGPERVPAGWRVLVEGQVDLTLGAGEPARLGVVPTALGLFGPAASAVGVVALVRLAIGEPARAGMLAFGAESRRGLLRRHGPRADRLPGSRGRAHGRAMAAGVTTTAAAPSLRRRWRRSSSTWRTSAAPARAPSRPTAPPASPTSPSWSVISAAGWRWPTSAP